MRHFPAALWSMTRCSARYFRRPGDSDLRPAGLLPGRRICTARAARYHRRFARSCEDGGGDDRWRDVVFAPRCCTPNARLWHLPGSIVRKGESAKRAAVRGVREEVGYDLPEARGGRLVVDLSGDEAHKFFYQRLDHSIPPSGRPSTTRGSGPLPTNTAAAPPGPANGDGAHRQRGDDIHDEVGR
jgi:8-oxo-dGTP pyrophosphatase MutT (NUDIX family)